MNKNWFEVDKKGLQALQAGKSKTFIIRELVQNAFDEDIHECNVNIEWLSDGNVVIIVEDDSPEGFKNLTHAYTLYADTYKRRDVKKRGRFNIGEKEVLSLCEHAEIRTTKGTIAFRSTGREKLSKKRHFGSEVYLHLKMKHSEFKELIEYAATILPPKGIHYRVNNNTVHYKFPFTVISETLKTEILEDNIFRSTRRKTDIYIHKEDKAYLYEMGIPVCEIDCDYSIDVQQKVPLSTDRTKVSGAYLKELYAFVLNATYEELTEESSSNNWIRTATTSDKIKSVAVEKVVKERYGDKVVVASPGDPGSVDEAITRGYRVIRGSEMSADEWRNVRKNNIIESSTSTFGSKLTDDYEVVKPTRNMIRAEDFIKRVANRLLSVQAKVRYVKSKTLTHAATYGYNTITFNLTKLPDDIFDIKKDMISQELLDLVMHELAHEKGYHYEHAYHKCLTMMGSKLTFLMRDEPGFFKI